TMTGMIISIAVHNSVINKIRTPIKTSRFIIAMKDLGIAEIGKMKIDTAGIIVAGTKNKIGAMISRIVTGGTEPKMKYPPGLEMMSHNGVARRISESRVM